MEKNIQDYDFLYDFLRYYVDFSFKLAYQRVEYRGLENIPKDGAVIFAPNHTNGLQDALAILAIDHGPKVFVARADIFRKPTLRKILTFLKIMPILRKRDGMENLGQNDAIMEKASQVLMDKVPFCIMAEGTHRPKHSLLPLLKGIFRIALKADSHIAGRMPVYIVPVGVEYGSYYRFRSSLLVNVGEPFDVSAYRKAHLEMSDAELLHSMREVLTKRMQDTIFYIPDDGDYEAMLTICHCVSEYRLRRKGVRNTLYNRMLMNKEVVSELVDLRSESVVLQAGGEVSSHSVSNASSLSSGAGSSLSVGDESSRKNWNELREAAESLSKQCSDKGISAYSLARPNLSLSIALHTVAVVLGLPFALYSVVAASPVLLVNWLVCRSLEDAAFRNSFSYVITMLLHPLVIAAWAAVLFCCIPCVWVALPLWVLTIFSVIISHDYWKMLRHWVSDIRLARLMKSSLRKADLSSCGSASSSGTSLGDDSSVGSVINLFRSL